MKKEALEALRLVIYHRLMAWEAASQAESALGIDVDSSCDSVDCLMASIDNPSDAMDLDEETLRVTFGID